MKHKKLPHIDLNGYYQFITFRTQDSLSEYLQKIYNKNIENNKKQMLIDEYLDSSSDGAYLYADKIDIFKEVLEAKDNELYQIIALAVMPNHIHILLKQEESLGKIMKYIKAKSAIELNKSIGRKGQFWAKDYYDRAIRNDAHFATVYDYILHNPIKAKLSDVERRVYSIYE